MRRSGNSLGVSRTSYGGGTCGIPCGKPLDPAAIGGDRGGSESRGRELALDDPDGVVGERCRASECAGGAVEPGVACPAIRSDATVSAFVMT